MLRAFVFSVIFISGFATTTFAEETKIYIESMTNASNVAILGTQVSNKVKAGQILEVGTRIQTRESAARIVFIDGSAVTLGKNSEVEIKSSDLDPKTKTQNEVLVLKNGFMHARVRKGLDASTLTHFLIEAPGCIVAVRGTEFTMSISDKLEVQTHVLEGKVTMAVDRPKLEGAQPISTGTFLKETGGLISPPDQFSLSDYRKNLSMAHAEVHKLIYNQIKSQKDAESVPHGRRRRKK